MTELIGPNIDSGSSWVMTWVYIFLLLYTFLCFLNSLQLVCVNLIIKKKKTKIKIKPPWGWEFFDWMCWPLNWIPKGLYIPVGLLTHLITRPLLPECFRFLTILDSLSYPLHTGLSFQFSFPAIPSVGEVSRFWWHVFITRMDLHGFKNYHAYHSRGGKHILKDLLYCYVESTVLNAVKSE